MANDQAHLLHGLVVETFAELGAVPTDGVALQERILIQDGHYAGYRFLLGEWDAMWFVERPMVEFFNPAGKMVRSCEILDGEPVLQAKAA